MKLFLFACTLLVSMAACGSESARDPIPIGTYLFADQGVADSAVAFALPSTAGAGGECVVIDGGRIEILSHSDARLVREFHALADPTRHYADSADATLEATGGRNYVLHTATEADSMYEYVGRIHQSVTYEGSTACPITRVRVLWYDIVQN